MKLPTLRQISGFAMIVNTFLPAIAVVALGMMIWSTASAIKRTGCATVSYARQAMNDDTARKRYVAAIGEDNKEAVLDEVVERLYRQAAPGAASCAAWSELRSQIADLLERELYTETAREVEEEIRKVEGAFQKVRKDVQDVVPEFPVIKPPPIAGVEDLVKAVNHLFRLTHNALTGLGKALARLGQGLTRPFDTAGKNIYSEMQTVDYKRAVALELLGRWSDDAAGSLEKFGWFFVVLALWLAFSYVLWVHRRLAAAWALLTRP